MQSQGVNTRIDKQLPWHVRAAVWLEYRFRPYLGWGVLFILALLAVLPSATLRVNEWVRLGSDQAVLEIIGPLSVVTVWLVAGWKRPRRSGRHRFLNAVVMAGLSLFIGLAVLSQAVAGWVPGIGEAVRGVGSGGLPALAADAAADWSRLGARFAFWWAGVETGTAIQDNLVFLAVASSVVWLFSAMSAMFARAFRNGLAAAAPLLWLLGIILLYSREGRILFVFGLGLAVLLHLLIDHETLLSHWREQGLDYSPGLFVDRLMLAAGAALLILTVAAVVPNLYIQPLVNRYYAEVRPVYETLEDTADRLFPGAKGTSRLAGGGLAGGMPNEFLLRAGPELSDTVVMRVRTNDAAAVEYPYDAAPPPGHYMRGGTLAVYDGRGWRNPQSTERVDVEANTQFDSLGDVGRKEVVQQIALSFTTRVLYTAPEPAEISADFRIEYRTPGDTVALWGRDKSYTVVSLVPAVSEESLNAAASWDDDNPLPESLAIHLALPDTVTDRTVALARSLVEGQPTMYDQAHAIEAHLRTYEYDLTVPAPPAGTVDVSDYFLFDLERGYCDYYATAFVALARIAGLPARFATGFAPGQWNPEDGIWTITEAEAHSWPEVYFPEYGWIAFEPTAGRPELTRVGTTLSLGATSRVPRDELTTDAETEVQWNWQMLFWLLPSGFLVWAGFRIVQLLRQRGEDPWQALVHWGGRAGRPMDSGETILEYGDGLANYVVGTQTQRQDLARVAATEMRELSGAVSSGHYAPIAEREQARARAARHWATLREYLRALRRGR